LSLEDLDPDIAAMIAERQAHPAASYEDIGPEAARADFRKVVETGRTPGWRAEPVHEVDEVELPGAAGAIRARRYVPRAEDRLPLVVYFHGGGWTIGDVETHDAQARMLANGAAACVLSVDYRLAPEHPYPAAFDDAVAALSWAAEHAADVGADASRLAVAGDSSGGNLAAAAALWARDEHGPPLAGQCLIYPVVDLHAGTGSWAEHGDVPVLTNSAMRWYIDNYAPNTGAREEPYASPLLAPDLRGLPPAIVATAGHDVLRDQGDDYARRLRDAGVPVWHRRYETLTHSFFRYSDISRAAKQANEAIVAALRDLLHGGMPG
jgi:acetyl esterase